MFQPNHVKPTAIILALSCLCLACFGGKPAKLDVTSLSIGPIDGETPFDRPYLEDLLKGYRITEGYAEDRGRSVTTVRVLLEGQEMIEIYPGPDGASIDRIVVKSPDIVDGNGNHVGTSYTSIFGDAPAPNAQPGMSEYSGHVLCPAPGLSNVTYIFHGDWSGPDGVIPPQNILQTWSVKIILWRS